MKKITGPGDSECYQLTHESGAEAVIARQGGHILSWKTADGVERLFLSDRADFSPGKAIRGGVPVIFPQFSDHGPFGRHGFARKSEWVPDTEGGRLILKSPESSSTGWPFECELALCVKLSADQLAISLSVENTGSEEFNFQAALHTYLRVRDIDKASVGGLEGFDFINEVSGKAEKDEHASIVFGKEVDRAYLNGCVAKLVLQSGYGELNFDSENLSDVVVWNPGPDHGIGDLSEDGWREFICVEAAQIQNPPKLGPGEKWQGTQTLRVK